MNVAELIRALFCEGSTGGTKLCITWKVWQDADASRLRSRFHNFYGKFYIRELHHRNSSASTSPTGPLMVDPLLGTVEFLQTLLARVVPEWLPALALLVRRCAR